MAYHDDMARPLGLTQEVADSIISDIRKLTPREHAARAAGVPTSTFYHWMRLGRAEKHRIEEGLDPDPKADVYLQFSEAVEQARADGIASAVSDLRNHGRKSPQALEWLLERAEPTLFGPHRLHEVTLAKIEEAIDRALRETLETLDLDAEQVARARSGLAEKLRASIGDER